MYFSLQRELTEFCPIHIAIVLCYNAHFPPLNFWGVKKLKFNLSIELIWKMAINI